MVAVSVTLTNTGEKAGQEVAQLYVRQPVARISRPLRQLEAFAKVMLQPGESRRVTLTIPVAALGYHDAFGRPVVEPSRYEVFVGASSLAALKGEFSVEERVRR
jgi:beta-glucosidase